MALTATCALCGGAQLILNEGDPRPDLGSIKPCGCKPALKEPPNETTRGRVRPGRLHCQKCGAEEVVQLRHALYKDVTGFIEVDAHRSPEVEEAIRRGIPRVELLECVCSVCGFIIRTVPCADAPVPKP